MAQRRRELLEAHRVLVAQLARGDAELLRRLRHRLAVLVGAGEKEDVLAALTHVPGEHIGRDRRVGVTQVRLAVDVVDGRGDVIGHPPSMLLGGSSPTEQRPQPRGQVPPPPTRGRATVLREAQQRSGGQQAQAGKDESQVR